MKWFVIILVCAGLAIAFIYRDKILGGSGKSSSAGGSSAGGTTPETSPSPVGPRPEPPVTPKKPEIDPDIERKFPLPKFQTLEDLVGNWQSIPPSAFPRAVTVAEDLDILTADGVGKSTIEAGTTVTAVAASGDQLTVTKHIPGSDGSLIVSPAAATGKIGIDETDFKQVLTDIYDAWMKRKVNQVLTDRKNAMRERLEGSLAGSTPSPEPGTPATAPASVPEPGSIDPKVGPRPEQDSSGKVPVMVASIRDGDVNEIRLDEIERWGPVRYEHFENEPYWTGTVNYKTATLFGIIDTEAMALIRKGKVINWVYTGSGEDVP